MHTYTLHRGTAPLLISLPHDGTALSPGLEARLVPAARRVPDTDWHVSTLYDFAKAMGASILVPRFSRYVVDLNRPPDDVSLYPGQNTTGLCPHVAFTGEPIYLEGELPAEAEVRARVATYWAPYHAALANELARIREDHGRAVLWEGHSIRSVVPFLFDGRLPDFNLGTAGGRSCSPALQARLQAVLDGQDAFTHITNGRFQGGYITRHYAAPPAGVEAVQLELAQLNYMDEDAFEYLPAVAAPTQALIRRLLEATLA